MIDEETVTTLELLGDSANLIGEVHGLLIDQELLEGEGHEQGWLTVAEEKVESGK